MLTTVSLAKYGDQGIKKIFSETPHCMIPPQFEPTDCTVCVRGPRVTLTHHTHVRTVSRFQLLQLLGRRGDWQGWPTELCRCPCTSIHNSNTTSFRNVGDNPNSLYSLLDAGRTGRCALYALTESDGGAAWLIHPFSIL